MNEMSKRFYSRRKSACPGARVILAVLLAWLPTAGCEKKDAGTAPPPPTTKAKPAPATVPPDPQPEKAAKQASRVADTEILPSPQQIFDRHIEVTGGREAYEKLRNVQMQGTITVTRSGQSMDFTEYRAAPNKHLQIMEPEDQGVRSRGCDGETVWLLSEDKDPFILEGPPRAALMRKETFNSSLYMADLYEFVETVGIEEVGEIECYHVRLTPPQGLTESNFYSIDSGLLVMRRVLVRVGASYGDVPRELALGEYCQVRSSEKQNPRRAWCGVSYSEQLSDGWKRTNCSRNSYHNSGVTIASYAMSESTRSCVRRSASIR